MATTRTFIAVPATDETRRRAVQVVRQLEPHATDVKWVAAENLHWTLHFLGDVEDTLLASVCDTVAAAAGRAEPFMLESCGAGAFPTVERPRTIWIGAKAGSAEMISLQADIQSSLAALGFPGENRRFTPHLTLGRSGRKTNFRTLGSALAELDDYDAGSSVVEEVVVYGSQLGREGPTYHVIGRAAVGA